MITLKKHTVPFFIFISLALARPDFIHAAENAEAVKVAPVEAYANLPRARDARLSPNGKKLALIAPVNGRDALVIWDLAGKEKSKVISTGEFEPSWFFWKSDQRLIASLRFYSLRNPQHATADSRLISIDSDGGKPVVLVKPEQFVTYIPQLQDKIVSLLPNDENHILVELPALDRNQTRPDAAGGITQFGSLESAIKYPEVVKVNINTGRLTTLNHQFNNVTHWQADAEGNVRLGQSIKDRTIYYEVKSLEDGSWHTIQPFDANSGRIFHPLAFVENNPDRLYALSNHEGGPTALYELDVIKDVFIRKIASSTASDVSATAKNGRLISYTVPENLKPVYIDSNLAKEAKIINRALPDSENVIIDQSRDGKRILVEVSKDNEPSAYWILEHGEKNVLSTVAESYPDLDPAQIAKTKIVYYNARDGLKIPALLTLPSHSKTGQPLPFVVLPHGGPTSHDATGFDYLVQFLASRGYGVLQPQFRGSTGFGAAFETAGLQQWGLAMQDDLTDGTRWLVQQKYADPKRIAIVGASYGGYAALMGAVKEPELYRAAAAIAPVTDLNQLIDQNWDFLFSDLNTPRIGTDKAILDKTSPARNAESIKIPLLLVHGRKDYTVPVNHTENMATALRKANKPFELVYLEEGDHYLSRSNDRLTTLKALEKFLAANL